MKIWTVASIRESDQLETRHTFKSFWTNLSPNCREAKNRLLGAQAIKELMEMITVHLQRLTDNLEKFDAVSDDLTQSIPSTMMKSDAEIKSKSTELIQNLIDNTEKRLSNLEMSWQQSLHNDRNAN